MKAAIINFSDLGDRWDAPFHLLNKEYAERAKALQKVMSKEDIYLLLGNEHAISTNVLKLISPLTRGNSESPSRDQLMRAVTEYPFLAMAIIKDKGQVLIDSEKDALKKKIEAMNNAKKLLNKTSPNIPNILQIPDGEKESLDKNSFVAGVVYFDGDQISIPVETSLTAYVADCWVIDLADWTGPSMIDDLVNEGNVPVPRRKEDLGLPVGFVKELTDHTVNYGMGWGPRDRMSD